MKALSRQDGILNYLKVHGTATVHRLAAELYASESTIRRDLALLEKHGKLRRTFGGAVEASLLTREVPLSFRSGENGAAKDVIAQKAAAEITDGSTLFLDASTTVMHLLPKLTRFHDLTIVTNGLQTSLMLGDLGIDHLCTGGRLLSDSLAYVGPFTCRFFRKFNADLVFFSSRGVTEDGMICDSSIEETQVREAMLSGSGRKIFLCDSSKFGKPYRCNLRPVNSVDRAYSELANADNGFF